MNKILTYRNKCNYCGNKFLKSISTLLHKVKYLYNLQVFLFLKTFYLFFISKNFKVQYTLGNDKNQKFRKEREWTRKEIEHP